MKCTGQGRARALSSGRAFALGSGSGRRLQRHRRWRPPRPGRSSLHFRLRWRVVRPFVARLLAAKEGALRRPVFFLSVVFISVVASVNSCCFYFFVEKKGVTSSRVVRQVLTPGNILMSHKKLIESKVSTCLSIMSVDTLCGAFS